MKNELNLYIMSAEDLVDLLSTIATKTAKELSDEVDNLISKNESLENDKLNLEDENSDLVEENADLRRKNSILEDEVSGLEGEITNLKIDRRYNYGKFK